MTTQETKQLGITGTYKGEQIGFTPIKDNKLADANYTLWYELGRKQYNRFEDVISKSLAEGIKAGTINFNGLHLEWSVMPESEYDNV